MITASELRPGTTFENGNDIFLVLESQISKVAMRQAHVKVKVKNLRSGSITTQTYTSTEKFKPAYIEHVKIQFLYSDNDKFHFLNTENYEQYEITKNRLDWDKNFLKEGILVDLVTYNGEILTIKLPLRVELQVTETEAAVKGNTATSAMKRAVLETGYAIQVPLFIKEGDLLVIDTESGKYISRA